MVDPWDMWPGRRLPPMPNPTTQNATHSTVDASLDFWPGADELPLPDLSVPSPPSGSRVAAGRPAGAGVTRGAVPSGDDAAESDDESLALLAVFNVDPWSTWPDSDEIPTPGQVAPPLAIADEQAIAASSDAAAAPEAGAGPTDFGPAAMLIAAVGAVAGLWRWRIPLMALATTWRDQLTQRSWLSGVRRLPGRRLARAAAVAAHDPWHSSTLVGSGD